MGTCRHRYPWQRPPCPHAVPPGSDCCLWHNLAVTKAEAYVAVLLQGAVEAAAGDLEHSHLAGIVWPNARLARARLAGSDLRDADLPGADLSDADLSGCSLRRANLRGAILHGARLEGADLTQARLNNADLREADLSRCRLSGTILLGADLRNANLKDAVVEAFQWNRLTRFSGIRGLEARGASTQSDVTQRFIAPAALADHDLADGQRDLLQGRDPEVERTRLYRRAAAPDRGASAEVSLEPHAAPASYERRILLYRRTNRILVAACAACLLLGLASAGGAWALRSHAVAPVRPGPDAALGRTGQPRWAQERREMEARIAALKENLEAAGRQESTLKQANETMRQRLAQLSDERQRLQLDSHLAVAGEDTAILRRQLADARQDFHRLESQNARLRRTAAILSDGVERLGKEKTELELQRDTQLVSRARVAELQEKSDALAIQCADGQARLETAGKQKAQLQRELQSAYQAMEAVTQRVQGTQLEGLLGQGHAREPLLPLSPGKPVTIGGDYLVTLLLEPQKEEGSLLCQVTVQGPPRQALPDLAVVLYGEGEVPRRKLSFSFLGEHNGTGFATLSTALTMRGFPTAARVLIAPADVAQTAKN